MRIYGYCTNQFFYSLKSIFILIAFCLVTQLSNAQSNSDQEQNFPGSIGQSGVTVIIDPQTGEKKGSALPEQSKAIQNVLKNASNRSAAGLVEQALPGKGAMVDLRGRFQSSLTVQMNSNGQRIIGH